MQRATQRLVAQDRAQLMEEKLPAALDHRGRGGGVVERAARLSDRLRHAVQIPRQHLAFELGSGVPQTFCLEIPGRLKSRERLFQPGVLGTAERDEDAAVHASERPHQRELIGVACPHLHRHDGIGPHRSAQHGRLRPRIVSKDFIQPGERSLEVRRRHMGAPTVCIGRTVERAHGASQHVALLVPVIGAQRQRDLTHVLSPPRDDFAIRARMAVARIADGAGCHDLDGRGFTSPCQRVDGLRPPAGVAAHQEPGAAYDLIGWNVESQSHGAELCERRLP